MPAKSARTQGNFIIPYVFDKNMDRVRRDAFVEATKAWEVRAARRASMGRKERSSIVYLVIFRVVLCGTWALCTMHILYTSAHIEQSRGC